jgi:hypothetical protein
MVRPNAEGCEMVLLYVLDVCTSSAAICMNQTHHKPTSSHCFLFFAIYACFRHPSLTEVMVVHVDSNIIKSF